MTRYRVEPERLGVLGDFLDQLAEELWWTAQEARSRGWAVGPGRCQHLLQEVLGDVEHQRLVLARAMQELGAAVRGAGAVYAHVDDAVAGALPGAAGPGSW